MATLTRFAETHGITYPLLADVGSVFIERLGILNTTMEQERAAYGRAMEERHRGLPYPGSFVLDTDGIVVSKRFEQSHRIRPTVKTLLGDLGRTDGQRGRPDVAAEANSPGVQVAAWLDTGTMSANQLQELHIRFELDDDVHLYTEPVPDGFQALEVTVSGHDQLQVDAVELPTGHEFRVEGLDETFSVVAGTVELSVPFFLLSNRDTAGDQASTVNMSAELRYQACTGAECFMPERLVLDLPFRHEPNPGYETTDMAALAPLVIRRIIEGPKQEAELLSLVNAALQGVAVTESELRDVLQGLVDRGLVTQADDGRWSDASS